MGNRPAYNITIKSNKSINNFNEGTVTTAFKYKPSSYENSDNIRIVQIINGKPVQIASSYFNDDWIYWNNTFNSVFGVGLY
jgi:hypothetical protein